MRRATIIAASLISVLALAVGAMAFPAVVGLHVSLPGQAGHAAAAPTPKTNHTSGDDNGTENETAPPASNETEPPEANDTDGNETAPPPAPEMNETENETGMGNVTVQHNVTVVQMDNTTWINGTIMVDNATATLVDLSFQIVVHDNGTANVTFSKSVTVGSATLTVQGTAVFMVETRSGIVFGTVSDVSNGVTLWEKPFGFAIGSEDHYSY